MIWCFKRYCWIYLLNFSNILFPVSPFSQGRVVQWFCVFQNELLSKFFVWWRSEVLILLLSVLTQLCVTTVPHLSIVPCWYLLTYSTPSFSEWICLYQQLTVRLNQVTTIANFQFLYLLLQFFLGVSVWNHFFAVWPCVFNACICFFCRYLKFICAGSTAWIVEEVLDTVSEALRLFSLVQTRSWLMNLLSTLRTPFSV